MERSDSTDDSAVIAVITVSVKLHEIRKQAGDVVKSSRTVGFSGEKDVVPGCLDAGYRFLLRSCVSRYACTILDIQLTHSTNILDFI